MCRNMKDMKDLEIYLFQDREFQAVGLARAKALRWGLSCKFSKNIKDFTEAGVDLVRGRVVREKVRELIAGMEREGAEMPIP